MIGELYREIIRYNVYTTVFIVLINVNKLILLPATNLLHQRGLVLVVNSFIVKFVVTKEECYTGD